MKTVLLMVVALLWWQHGYSHEVCKVKNNIPKEVEANDQLFDSAMNWIEYVDEPFTDSCLRAWLPNGMNVYVKQIDSAYTLGLGEHILRIAILPRFVDKNGVGLYYVGAGNNNLTMEGCALYDGKQVLLPTAPEVRSPYISDIPKDIYQTRMKVVEVFFLKHNNFTKEIKKRIRCSFCKGTLHTLPEPRYF